MALPLWATSGAARSFIAGAFVPSEMVLKDFDFGAHKAAQLIAKALSKGAESEGAENFRLLMEDADFIRKLGTIIEAEIIQSLGQLTFQDYGAVMCSILKEKGIDYQDELARSIASAENRAGNAKPAPSNEAGIPISTEVRTNDEAEKVSSSSE